MSEMIERVAKAIAHAEFNRYNSIEVIESMWAWFDESLKDKYLSQARAAITAMREPTDAMLSTEARTDVGYMSRIDDYLDWFSANEIYRAMIDEALRE